MKKISLDTDFSNEKFPWLSAKEIDVNLANSSPIGVDTHEDYMEIKKLMEYKK